MPGHTEHDCGFGAGEPVRILLHFDQRLNFVSREVILAPSESSASGGAARWVLGSFGRPSSVNKSLQETSPPDPKSDTPKVVGKDAELWGLLFGCKPLRSMGWLSPRRGQWLRSGDLVDGRPAKKNECHFLVVEAHDACCTADGDRCLAFLSWHPF